MFQVDKEKTQVVDDFACYVDSAASSHMVDEQSHLSHHVLNPVDCAVRIIGSCGTSDATKKGTLKFGVRNDQDQVVLNVIIDDVNLGAVEVIARR